MTKNPLISSSVKIKVRLNQEPGRPIELKGGCKRHANLLAIAACRRAGLPYAPSVLGAGLAFGAWHGLSPNSLFLAALGAYWGHLYAQTRNVLVPVSMHAVWNAFTLGVGACVVSQTVS